MEPHNGGTHVCVAKPRGVLWRVLRQVRIRFPLEYKERLHETRQRRKNTKIHVVGMNGSQPHHQSGAWPGKVYAVKNFALCKNNQRTQFAAHSHPPLLDRPRFQLQQQNFAADQLFVGAFGDSAGL